MSYWGRPGSSPAWAASHGPSPVVPLLIVMALGWVICNSTLSEWYEQGTEVQETVTNSVVLLVLGAGLLLLAAAGNHGELVLVPMALVVVMFLIQNIMIVALLLVAAAYFVGIYYYRPDRGYGGYGGMAGCGDWGSGGGGLGGGLGFYMLFVLCLVLCAMFSEDGGSWWVPGVLLVVCLLCLNLFSGGKVWGSEYQYF